MPPFRFPKIHLIDTAVASDNIGDETIVEACREALAGVLCRAYVTSSSGHDGLGRVGRQLAAEADMILLLGTNALSAKAARWRRPFIWHVSWKDHAALRGKVVLCGVGANRSFLSLEARQRRFLRTVLSTRHLHAVRDESGLAILEACGLEGVNAACPTLWRWRNVQPQPPRQKARDVCFTLTNHKSDPEMDRWMVDILRASYGTLWFWSQQRGDLPYLQSLTDTSGIRIVPPNLPAYDDLLRTHAVDVVGTRLHGTIRGLMHGRRSIVIAIDNRATELGPATGLPTITRREIPARLQPMIDGAFETQLRIDAVACDRFLHQFQPKVNSGSREPIVSKEAAGAWF